MLSTYLERRDGGAKPFRYVMTIPLVNLISEAVFVELFFIMI